MAAHQKHIFLSWIILSQICEGLFSSFLWLTFHSKVVLICEIKICFAVGYDFKNNSYIKSKRTLETEYFDANERLLESEVSCIEIDGRIKTVKVW